MAATGQSYLLANGLSPRPVAAEKPQRMAFLRPFGRGDDGLVLTKSPSVAAICGYIGSLRMHSVPETQSTGSDARIESTGRFRQARNARQGRTCRSCFPDGCDGTARS